MQAILPAPPDFHSRRVNVLDNCGRFSFAAFLCDLRGKDFDARLNRSRILHRKGRKEYLTRGEYPAGNMNQSWGLEEDGRGMTKVTPSGTSGPFCNQGGPLRIALFRTEGQMNNISIRDGLLAALTERYEADPAHFVSLPRQVVDSSSARAVIADLRNEGYIEEQERGVIRFTRRGYESLRERFDSTGDESRILLAV